MPRARVNGHEIYYFDSQAGNCNTDDLKIPIVMIHGLGSSHVFYLPVIARLNAHRCIAIDTYGAGASKSHGEHLTLHQLAADVVGLLDNLTISRAIVVGHSMGGPMACQVAISHPDRVAGLVCIGPVDPLSVDTAVFADRIRIAQSPEGIETLASTIPQSATNSNSTALQRALIRSLILNQDPLGYVSHCRVIMQRDVPDFASIRASTLILAGGEDKAAPVAGCRRILEQLCQCGRAMKILPGVGHWHCIEAADVVGEEISEFILQVSRSI